MKYSDLIASGTRITIVANDTARDSISDPSNGTVVLTTSDDALNVYDLDTTSWIKITGVEGGESSGTGVNYLEIKPSSIYIDDVLDGVMGGELFNIVPSYDFSPSQQGAVFFDFKIPDSWYTDDDILFDLYIALDGTDTGKYVKLKGEFWVINSGDSETESSPTESGYDLLLTSIANQGKFTKYTPTGFKITSTNLSTTGATIACRITRVADDASDTYSGIFKLIKIIVRQANYSPASQLLGSSSVTVSNKTSNYGMSSSDSGKLFTNTGATSAVIMTLPSATPGMRIEIVKSELYGLTIKPKSGELVDGIADGKYFDLTGNKNVSLILSGIASGRWNSVYRSPSWLMPGDRGVFGGGWTTIANNTIDYVSISTVGNAIDFGDTSVARQVTDGFSNGVNDRGIFGSGYTTAASNIIDYITISTIGNALDFGDTTFARYGSGGTSNGVNDRGIIGGGHIVGGPSNNIIDYVTISTIGNALDFGDLTLNKYVLGATSNNINNRGIFASGITTSPSVTNVIDYVTINTVGNALDFGDLTLARYGVGSTSNGINNRAVFSSGATTSNNNTIDYVAISTTSNALDFGDVITAREQSSACSNTTNERAVFGGGYTTGPVSNIEYLTIAILSNSTNFGSLTLARYAPGGLSNA